MLHIDINKFITIFNRNNLYKFTKYYVLFFFIFTLAEITTFITIYNDALKDYNARIEKIASLEGEDLSLMCSVVTCKTISNGIESYAVGKDGYLVESKNTFIESKYLKLFTNDFNTIIRYGHYTLTIDDQRYLTSYIKILIINSIIFFIIYSYLFINTVLIENRNRVMEKSSYKITLENKLQRDITESAHHEMGMPVALIKSLINDLYSTLYPCEYSKSGICNIYTTETDVNISKCKLCPVGNFKRNYDELAKNYFTKLKFAIERLETPLNQMAESKHLKYSNGNTSIYVIIDNIITTNNSYKVNKIRATFLNKDILKTHAVGYSMTNGDLLNIIHAHVTNSLEAKATSIVFSASLHSDKKKIDIYMADNGIGIQDKFGNIVETNDIFNYGYSTKTMSGDLIVHRSLFIKVLIKLGIVVESIVARGAGLSVTRELATRSGGDVKLVSTSKEGTIFKITIPVKIKRND